MKKQMMKVGLVAALVMGAMSAANAASVADLTFTGAVTKATCDVNVVGGNTQTISLGKYAAAEFVAVGTPLAKSSKQVTLSFGSCIGEQIAAGDSLVLSVSQQSGLVPALSNAGLWGDNAIGVGVQLTAESQDPDLIPVDTLTPDENEMQIFTADNETPAADAAPQPVVLTAALASYLPSASITSGTIKAPLEFSVSYD
ncbi:fimbrial protein [Serratia marcescens]|uniref:fimbrial protein n=1 Tax=Serratia marcescens TaxID=615 RepID=UPI0024C4ADE4|nr:fimbrial protein [Serratia marcescens]MDK1711687.1 fimbrial protein [Serratia marcescens]